MIREAVEVEKRRATPYAWKARIWASQDFRCALCWVRLGAPEDAEYDHVVPLALGGRHDIMNIEALCRTPCHLEKTKADIRRIAKAKRIARKNDPSTRPVPKRKLQGRGFDKRLSKGMDGRVRTR